MSGSVSALRVVAAVVLAVLALTACAKKSLDGPRPPDQSPPQVEGLPPLPSLSALRGFGVESGRAQLYRRPIPPDGTIFVALLLPLSGPSAGIGESMLNAAEMALFEAPRVEKLALLPFDTGGTPDGAAAAAERAIVRGAQVILGPLLAHSVRAVTPLAQEAGIQVIAFSNSRGVASDGVYILGFDPQQQVAAITKYALSQGLTRLAVLAPRGEYGDVVVQSMQATALEHGGTITRSQYYDPAARDHSAAVKAVTDFDLRHKALLEQRAALEKQKDEVSKAALKRLEKLDTIGEVEFDAILLPESGQTLRALASLLLYYDVDVPRVRVLGLADWDEMRNPGRELALVGGWYAGVPPQDWDRFVVRYKQIFGKPPVRIASLAYDATALAAIVAHSAEGADYSREMLTNPNGFIGVNGLFRLNPDGVAERAYAVLEVRKKETRVLQPPPQTFEQLRF